MVVGVKLAAINMTAGMRMRRGNLEYDNNSTVQPSGMRKLNGSPEKLMRLPAKSGLRVIQIQGRPMRLPINKDSNIRRRLLGEAKNLAANNRITARAVSVWVSRLRPISRPLVAMWAGWLSDFFTEATASRKKTNPKPAGPAPVNSRLWKLPKYFDLVAISIIRLVIKANLALLGWLNQVLAAYSKAFNWKIIMAVVESWTEVSSSN